MIRGMLCLLSGFRHLFAEAELRAVVWRMLMLLAVLMLLLSVGVYELSQYLAARFIPTGDAWYVPVLAWLSWLFSLLLALAVGLVSYVVLGSVVSAPWLDMLAERVEQGAVHAGRQPWWRIMVASLASSVMPLLQFIPYALLSLLLLLVPVYGTAVAGIVWSYAGIRLLAYEFLDTPAARRGWGWPERKAALENNRWFYFGFAGLASGLLLVPVLNLFVLPAAVVGLSRFWLQSPPSGSDGADKH